MIKAFLNSISVLILRRELITILVSKELKSRYRGSMLGMLWTFLNPLLLLIVYALVFSVYMRVQQENYAVFLFTGLLPWIWFSSSVIEGSTSITSSGSLITKSMFPAEILPMVKVMANLMNYIFSLPLLFFFIFYYGIPVTKALMWLPVVMLAQMLLTTGLVFILAAINVRFRDTQHILNNLLVLWFFLCPILYPIKNIPQEYHWTFKLNPMAVLSMAYQDIFFHGARPGLKMIAVIYAAGIGLTLGGFWIFEKSKETFAEDI